MIVADSNIIYPPHYKQQLDHCLRQPRASDCLYEPGYYFRWTIKLSSLAKVCADGPDIALAEYTNAVATRDHVSMIDARTIVEFVRDGAHCSEEQNTRADAIRDEMDKVVLK